MSRVTVEGEWAAGFIPSPVYVTAACIPCTCAELRTIRTLRLELC